MIAEGGPPFQEKLGPITTVPESKPSGRETKLSDQKCGPGLGILLAICEQSEFGKFILLFRHVSWAPNPDTQRRCTQPKTDASEFVPERQLSRLLSNTIRCLCGGAILVAKHKSLKTNPSAQSGVFCLVIGCLSRNTRDTESQRPASVQMGA